MSDLGPSRGGSWDKHDALLHLEHDLNALLQCSEWILISDCCRSLRCGRLRLVGECPAGFKLLVICLVLLGHLSG